MLSTRLVAAIAMVLAAVALTAGVVFYTSSATKAIINQISLLGASVNGPVTGNASFAGTGVLSYNNSRSLVEYALLRSNFTNVTSANFTLRMYRTNPIASVYLLNVGFSCFKCYDEGALLGSLSNYLNSYNLIRNRSSINYLNISDIASTPPNSIIIIPSGLMPSSLLPLAGASISAAPLTILDLLRRGDTIIYAGQNFSRSIQNGIVYLNSNSTLGALAASGLNTTAPSKTITASNAILFNSPTFRFIGDRRNGTITYVSSNSGTFIAFSNYPTSGWSNSSAMASDIASAIFSRFWMPIIAQGLAQSNSGKAAIPIFATNVLLNNTKGVNNLINSSYSLIIAYLNNSRNSVIRQFPFRLMFQNNGTIGMPPVVGTGQSIPVSIFINAGISPQNVVIGNFSKNALLYHIDIFNSTLQYIYEVPIGFFNTSLGVVKYQSFLFSPGLYIASLRDINNRIYENALFRIVYLKITPLYIDFKNGTFVFGIVNNNQTVSGVQYSASIGGAYNETGVITNGLLNYTLPQGAVINYGRQVITFNIFGTAYNYTGNYSKPPVQYIPPLYIEFAIAAFVVIFLNLIIRTPIRDEYYIDVPALLPTKKTEVKIDSGSIINIFDTVNYRYHWRYMPLTPEEIKSGISTSMRHNNMPLLITTENTSEILYGLANSGQLLAIGPYFIPRKWIDSSNHDVEYLVVFRKLRDFAVKNAMLFTEIDSSGNVDMILTTKGTQSYIYIYSQTSGMREVRIAEGARTFIVFLNAEARMSFVERLHNIYSQDAVRLRMGIALSFITPIDTENLEPLVY